MRAIKYIAVHCTAGNQKQTANDVVEYHLRSAAMGGRGWKSPGYHYLIEASGKVVNSHPIDKLSNGVQGYNANTINVCWIGGVHDGKAVDNRTEAQKESLRAVIDMLHKQFPAAIIKGHRDFSPDTNHNGKVDKWERIKECPCFDAIVEYKDIQAR